MEEGSVGRQAAAREKRGAGTDLVTQRLRRALQARAPRIHLTTRSHREVRLRGQPPRSSRGRAEDDADSPKGSPHSCPAGLERAVEACECMLPKLCAQETAAVVLASVDPSIAVGPGRGGPRT